MKMLTTPTAQQVDNCWGGTAHVVLTDYEIEQDDVGKRKLNYLGHARYAYTFDALDVGRRIREDSSSGGCWYFLT